MICNLYVKWHGILCRIKILIDFLRPLFLYSAKTEWATVPLLMVFPLDQRDIKNFCPETGQESWREHILKGRRY